MNDGDGPDAVRVLQISCRNGAGWVFPKGGWELDETAENAARRETVEEGGVRGRLESRPIGSYESKSRKEAGKGCISYMFALHVEEELVSWPEAGQRVRIWVCLFSSTIPFLPAALSASWHTCFHHARSSKTSNATVLE
jgi:diphosphoinositol-polyphosphate diphosphatase